MKFSKDWTCIKIILLIILIILIIYKLNGDTTETFNNDTQNDNKSDTTDNQILKRELSAILDISEDRIENIKISGLDPDIKVTFYIIPRDINDEESPKLESIQETITNIKQNMNYQFTIDGEMKNFTDIEVKPIEKNTPTKMDQLKNKFIDANIDNQIKHLNDVKYYIKDGVYIKRDNPMDRFYEFSKHGNLTIEDELQNPEPTEPLSENGVLDGDIQ